MRMLVLLSTALLLGLAGSNAWAFHKTGHEIEFPGAPSGQFVLYTIAAGAICTDAIIVPEGQQVLVHGGPKKFGFIGEEFVELVDVAEGVVQICFVSGEPLGGDVQVRVSFEPVE